MAWMRALAFSQALDDFEPDIVGISVMFDVSYKHVAGLAAAPKPPIRLPLCS